MKTFAEANDEPTIDWHKELSDPPEVSSPGYDELVVAASSWVTCACGNQCEAIPRNFTGAPFDSDLWDLGCIFASDIRGCNWEEAKTTLAKIEIRSQEILDEMQLATIANQN